MTGIAPDTIYALSSGALPSGVAIIRVSGPAAFESLNLFHVKHPPPRKAQLSILKDSKGQVLDQALVFSFPEPNSFTGENLVEYHCHGGPAVVTALLSELSKQSMTRLAERGEFTLRAYQNGKINLLEAEGLSDLINAQTENQRQLAMQHFGKWFTKKIDSWRETLLEMRAAVEADFDFSDEEDVPGSVAETISDKALHLADDIKNMLDDQSCGEIIRDGLKVVIVGPPNAGKSSLLNALARRDVAIVTNIPGTTRDVLSVSLNLEGQLVLVSDTAGLRRTDDKVEQEGIKRAMSALETAHLVLWLIPANQNIAQFEKPETEVPIWLIRTKSDITSEISDYESSDPNDGSQYISSRTGFGLTELTERIARFGPGLTTGGAKSIQSGERLLVSRHRHRLAFQDCVEALRKAGDDTQPLEIRVEFLRVASDALGQVLGHIDVEEILGHIFSEFCIGK